MKRILSLFLVCTLLLSLALPVSAAVIDPVQPCFAYIRSTYVSVSVNQSMGIANCYADCSANSGVTIVISGTLQQNKNNEWEDVKSWVRTGSGFVSLDKQWAVYSGYQYRLYVTYKIYNSAGILLESHTSYDTCTYN